MVFSFGRFYIKLMQRNLTVLSAADLSSLEDTTYDVDYTVEWDGDRLIEYPYTYEPDVALEHSLSKYRRQIRRLRKILKNQERRALRAWRQKVLAELNQQALEVQEILENQEISEDERALEGPTILETQDLQIM